MLIYITCIWNVAECHWGLDSTGRNLLLIFSLSIRSPQMRCTCCNAKWKSVSFTHFNFHLWIICRRQWNKKRRPPCLNTWTCCVPVQPGFPWSGHILSPSRHLGYFVFLSRNRDWMMKGMPKPYQLCTYSVQTPHKGTQPISSYAHLHLSDVCLSNPTFHFAEEFVIHSGFDMYLWYILRHINQN